MLYSTPILENIGGVTPMEIVSHNYVHSNRQEEEEEVYLQLSFETHINNFSRVTRLHLPTIQHWLTLHLPTLSLTSLEYIYVS